MSLRNLLTETKPATKQGGTPASANPLSFVGQAGGHSTGAAWPQHAVPRMEGGRRCGPEMEGDRRRAAPLPVDLLARGASPKRYCTDVHEVSVSETSF